MRERNLAAHNFSLEETIEAIQAMEDSHQEKSMYKKIAGLKAGGRILFDC